MGQNRHPRTLVALLADRPAALHARKDAVTSSWLFDTAAYLTRAKPMTIDKSSLMNTQQSQRATIPTSSRYAPFSKKANPTGDVVPLLLADDWSIVFHASTTVPAAARVQHVQFECAV